MITAFGVIRLEPRHKTVYHPAASHDLLLCCFFCKTELEV
jgi:hypothetical protein